MINLILFIWLAGAVVYFISIFVVAYVFTLGFGGLNGQIRLLTILYTMFISLFWPIWIIKDYFIGERL